MPANIVDKNPSTAWKLYFWFCATASTVALFDRFWFGIFQLVGVLGLYGYVWRIRVINPFFWQIYLLLLLIQLGYQGLGLLEQAALFSALPSLAAATLALFILIAGPQYFALIRYSSSKYKIWLEKDIESH